LRPFATPLLGCCANSAPRSKVTRAAGACTHNIDLEREFVRQSLVDSGLVGATTFLEPADSLKEIRTATGGEIKTDGRILVLILK